MEIRKIIVYLTKTKVHFVLFIALELLLLLFMILNLIQQDYLFALIALIGMISNGITLYRVHRLLKKEQQDLLRLTEVFLDGAWVRKKFRLLRHGDRFRLFQDDELVKDPEGNTEFIAESHAYRKNGTWQINIKDNTEEK